MKKTIFGVLALLSVLLPQRTQAQVSDLSVIVSPTAGYTFWNNNLNVGNSAFYGARVGFGFGPILEIRGNYERSFDLKGKLQGTGWNVANEFAHKLENSSITYERIGGDLKFNLWNNARFTPYILGGAGVLKFHYDDVVKAGHRVHEEQLYGNVGAGLKINFTRRVAFSLEARNMFFNAAPSSQYVAKGTDNTLQNWSALASLDLYLGGAPAAKDEVSKAYRQTFSGGFRGLRFVAEPSAAYLNFRDNSAFADTWMLGLSAGVDFTTLVGLRGFYYRATDKPDGFSTKLNGGLSLYGANLLTRLNVPRGVTPYLSLGAGYLNVDDKYSDRDPRFANAKSGWFALGGGGLEIPLHRMVSVFGSAEALLMEQDNPKLDEAHDPSSIKVNWMYRMGLRVNFGLKSKNGQAAYQKLVQAERDRVLAKQALQQNDPRLAAALADSGIVAREELLTRGVVLNDSLQKTHPELAKIIATQPTGNVILLNEAQLQRIVQRVLQATQVQNAQQQGGIFGNMSDLDKILLISALRNGQIPQQYLPQLSTNGAVNAANQEAQKANQQQIQQLQQQILLLQQQLQQNAQPAAPKSQPAAPQSQRKTRSAEAASQQTAPVITEAAATSSEASAIPSQQQTTTTETTTTNSNTSK